MTMAGGTRCERQERFLTFVRNDGRGRSVGAAPTALRDFLVLGSQSWRTGLTCGAPPALVGGGAEEHERFLTYVRNDEQGSGRREGVVIEVADATCVLGWVAHLRRSVIFWFGVPALAGWANVWRASGAGWEKLWAHVCAATTLAFKEKQIPHRRSQKARPGSG
jgi:hypothetical protein